MRPRLRALLILAVCALSLTVGVVQAEVVDGGNVQVSFHGGITPRNLPRGESVPVALHVEGTVHPVGAQRPAALRRVTVAINRHGIVSTRGLPICHRSLLEGSSSAQALQRCGGALVGTGSFRAHVEIPEGAPFPAVGRILAFSTTVHGHRALIAQVYGIDPVPTSQVLPIGIGRDRQGGFGATLSVQMPKVGDEWGYVTGFAMTFHRLYRYAGHTRSFLSASCPAPAGIGEAPFRAARGTYYLSGGTVLTRVVNGSCAVSRPGR